MKSATSIRYNLEQNPITVALAQRNIDLVKLLMDSGAETQKITGGENILYYSEKRLYYSE